MYHRYYIDYSIYVLKVCVYTYKTDDVKNRQNLISFNIINPSSFVSLITLYRVNYNETIQGSLSIFSFQFNVFSLTVIEICFHYPPCKYMILSLFSLCCRNPGKKSDLQIIRRHSQSNEKEKPPKYLNNEWEQIII